MIVITDEMAVEARERWSDCITFDIVKCLDCGFKGLIELGGENCPDCNEDHLQWEDENNQEFTI